MNQAFAIVVFASVDDSGADGPDCGSPLPRQAVAELARIAVPLVLVSGSAAPHVRRVQRHLRIEEPFVCDGGGAVHVPPSWRATASDIEDGRWERFQFNPPDRSAAVTLVRDLFVARRHDVLTVGIGCDLDDYGVLAAVDVPVVVRDPLRDQRELLRHVPGAYLTTATGVDGWLEALIGP